MRNKLFLALLTMFIALFSSSISFAAPCVATHTVDSLNSLLQSPTSCDKDENDRYLIQLNMATTLELSKPIIIYKNDIHLKNIGNTAITFNNSSDFVAFPGYEGCSIVILGTDNIVEGIRIQGRGICIANSTSNFSLKNTVSVYVPDGKTGYGIHLSDVLISSAISSAITLPNGNKLYPYITKLLCLNTIYGGSQYDTAKTNLDVNDNSIDDYQDLHNDSNWQTNCFYKLMFIVALEKGKSAFETSCQSSGGTYSETGNFPTCTCPAGKGLNQSGECAACGANQVLASGFCINCSSNEVAKNGACTACAINEIVQNNKCTACATGEIVQNNTCVKCPEGQIVKNGACSDTTCDSASEEEVTKGDGSIECACKDGFGRYQQADDFGVIMPCVSCGAGKSKSDGTCSCGSGQHRDIDGGCLYASKACTGANAVQESSGGDCICKDGFGISVYPDKQVACKVTGLCGEGFEWDQAKGVCWYIGQCPEGQVIKADGAGCEPGGGEPPAVSGDCGCNFGSAPVSTAQALLPYIMIGITCVSLRLSAGLLAETRRKRAKRSREIH